MNDLDRLFLLLELRRAISSQRFRNLELSTLTSLAGEVDKDILRIHKNITVDGWESYVRKSVKDRLEIAFEQEFKVLSDEIRDIILDDLATFVISKFSALTNVFLPDV